MACGVCLFSLWLNNFLLTSIACTATGAVQVFPQEPTTAHQTFSLTETKVFQFYQENNLSQTCKPTHSFVL